MPTVQAPQPFGSCPTSRQLAWQRMGMYNFFHFTVNTFTDKEWGHGTESPEVFNPSALDCEQWCRVVGELDGRNRKENAISDLDNIWISPATPYPHELVVDLGAALDIKGFIFTPALATEWGDGQVARYRFLVGAAADKVDRVVAEGSFDNILNSPTPRTVMLAAPARARFFRFVAVEPAKATNYACVKRLDVIA